MRRSATIYDNRACLAVLRGDLTGGLATLVVAIELAPDSKRLAREDDDLASIRAHDTFVRLIG